MRAEGIPGYGTKFHLEALQILGVSPVHRQSYAPVREILLAILKSIFGLIDAMSFPSRSTLIIEKYFKSPELSVRCGLSGTIPVRIFSMILFNLLLLYGNFI